MREDTAQWLNPMRDAAHLSPDEDRDLIRASCMPAAESMNPAVQWMARITQESGLPPGSTMAIDWVRYGYLLRHRLGWDDSYPNHPMCNCGEWYAEEHGGAS